MRAISLGIGLLLLGAAGAGRAQEMFACVTIKAGSMRMVTSPAECNATKETPVSWNIVGPQGPPGEQGPPGAQGDPGPPGPSTLRPVLVDSADQIVGYPLGAPLSTPSVAPEFSVIIFSNDGKQWTTFATLDQLVLPYLPGFNLYYVLDDCEGTPYHLQNPNVLHRFSEKTPGISDEMFAAGVFKGSDSTQEIPHPESYWASGIQSCTNILDHPGGTTEARALQTVELAPAVPPFRFEVR